MVWVSAGQWPEHWAVCLGRWEFSAGHRRPVGTLSLEASTLGFPPSLPAHPGQSLALPLDTWGGLQLLSLSSRTLGGPIMSLTKKRHISQESPRGQSGAATWGFREWTRPSADPRRVAGEARRALVPCRPRSGRCPLWWTRGAVCVQVSGKDSRIQVIGEMKPG